MTEKALYNRLTLLNGRPASAGPVIYWMNREQRIRDNQALLYAQREALRMQVPLAILFCLSPDFPGASFRAYDFMLKSLREVERDAARLNIPFVVKAGDPPEEAVAFAVSTGAGLVVTDFSPLRTPRVWKEEAGKRLSVPIYEADAHNIVPCRAVSGIPEFAARTLRPKIRSLLFEHLAEIPQVEKHPWSFGGSLPGNDWDQLEAFVTADRSVPPVDWLKPGEAAAQKTLDTFIGLRLSGYADRRNDPNLQAQSGLSPYLHFGQISSLRVALQVQAAPHTEDSAAFLEELIVRKELSDNFCLYNPLYDRYEGIPSWGRRTLEKHWNDARTHIYSPEAFEAAGTHDPLWNAAQTELLRTGKMHGYLRMYWAKKILEWSENPHQAFEIAVWLNDQYSLDGRDPNGYAGISWSVGGTHDRPWKERPVFGTIRYMNLDGCRRKFNVDSYVARWTAARDQGQGVV